MQITNINDYIRLLRDNQVYRELEETEACIVKFLLIIVFYFIIYTISISKDTQGVSYLD